MEQAYNYPQTATYNEYVKLVREDETNAKYEYLNSSIYLLASGTYEHCRIQARMAQYIGMSLDQEPCEPVTELDLHTSTKEFPHQVVRPDLMVVCDEEKVKDGKYSGIPTIVVEIVSVSSIGNDYFLKANLYRLIGVKEYYIVDPIRKQITVYTYDNLDFQQVIYKGDDIIQSTVFKKVKLRLGDIFKD